MPVAGEALDRLECLENQGGLTEGSHQLPSGHLNHPGMENAEAHAEAAEGAKGRSCERPETGLK